MAPRVTLQCDTWGTKVRRHRGGSIGQECGTEGPICDTGPWLIPAVRAASDIVAIGYAFNPFDRQWYLPLLRVAKRSTWTLIQPDAAALQTRLNTEYPALTWRALPVTFAEWAGSGFHLT